MKSWINAPKDITPYEGFIYEITNSVNGKKYIGKKTFWNYKKVKAKNGKKRGTRTKVESDWKTYWGSSRALTADYGLQKGRGFNRRILSLCDSRWEMSYREAELQFSRGVLLDPTYYNEYIYIKLRGLKRAREGRVKS